MEGNTKKTIFSSLLHSSFLIQTFMCFHDQVLMANATLAYIIYERFFYEVSFSRLSELLVCGFSETFFIVISVWIVLCFRVETHFREAGLLLSTQSFYTYIGFPQTAATYYVRWLLLKCQKVSLLRSHIDSSMFYTLTLRRRIMPF